MYMTGHGRGGGEYARTRAAKQRQRPVSATVELQQLMLLDVVPLCYIVVPGVGRTRRGYRRRQYMHAIAELQNNDARACMLSKYCGCAVGQRAS